MICAYINPLKIYFVCLLLITFTINYTTGDLEQFENNAELESEKPIWQQRLEEIKSFRYGIGKTKDVKQAVVLIQELIPILQNMISSKEKESPVTVLGELLSMLGNIYLVENYFCMN